MYTYRFNFFSKNCKCYGFYLYHNEDFTEKQLSFMQKKALYHIVKNKKSVEEFAKEPYTLSDFENIIVERICEFLIKEYNFKRIAGEYISDTCIDNDDFLEIFRGNKKIPDFFEAYNEIVKLYSEQKSKEK